MKSKQAQGFSSFFYLCCPPFPSKIASKIAFLPPEVPSYEFNRNSDEELFFKLLTHQNRNCLIKELQNVKPYFVESEKKGSIACLHFDLNSDPLYTIIYSHGNATDIGLISNFIADLSKTLKCNFFIYDYSGYGVSSGYPSEKKVNSNIECVYRFVTSKLNIYSDKIILYGQSIGSVPTVHLATKVECAGVVLQSPLASGLRIPFPQIERTYFFDVFKNISKVSLITSPTLYIHGCIDTVVPFTNSLGLYDKTLRKVEPLWMINADHNDVETFDEFYERLKKFVTQDLPNS